MADQAPIYDLMLLLDGDAPEEQRQRVLSGVASAISSAGGSVERDDDWGRRPMAYQIRHRPDAEYHLLQFRAPGTAIEELSHTLRITDGVLRFRVIKVRPGTPEVKSSPPPVVAAAASTSGGYSAPAEPSSPAAQEPAGASSEEPETEEQAPEDATPAEATATEDAAGAETAPAEDADSAEAPSADDGAAE